MRVVPVNVTSGLIVGLFLSSACPPSNEVARIDSPPRQTVVPALEDLSATPRFVGVVFATETANVAALRSGTVSEIFVQLGESVVAGQSLVHLSDPMGEQELAAGEAAFRMAHGERAAAEVVLEQRRQQLGRREEARAALASEELEDARFEARRSQSQLHALTADAERYRAQAARLRLELESLNVRASFDGSVAQIYHSLGEFVPAQAPVVRLVGTEVRLRFAVTETQLRQLPVGTEFWVQAAEESHPFRARVETVAPEIDGSSGLRFIEASFSFRGAAIAPGAVVYGIVSMSATVSGLDAE